MDHMEFAVRYSSRYRKIRRVYNIAIYFPLAISVLFFFYPDFPRVLASIFFISPNILNSIQYLLIAFSIGIWLLRYLQYGMTFPSIGNLFDAILFQDTTKIKETDLAERTKIDPYAETEDNPIAEDCDQILENTSTPIELNSSTLEDTVVPESANDNQIRVGAAKEPSVTIFKKENISPMSLSRQRLLLEVAKLGFRNNLNLVFGVLCAGTGLWLLSFPGFNTMVEKIDIEKFAINYIPRFTLVIFIEIFAYFFLNLYKKGLSEIKYFQNELTNIEAMEAALTTAKEIGNESDIAFVVRRLTKTERNHILEKGQTTVEVEVSRNEKSGLNYAVKSFAAALKVWKENEDKNN